MNDKFYEKRGVAPPSHVSHELTPDDISKRVKSVNPTNWRAEGNRLIADTDFGPLVQNIPTSHIFVGVDNAGLPKFRKIDTL